MRCWPNVFPLWQANLAAPITITLPTGGGGRARGRVPSCAYLDRRAQLWRTDGRVLEGSGGNASVTCAYAHLTDFGILDIELNAMGNPFSLSAWARS